MTKTDSIIIGIELRRADAKMHDALARQADAEGNQERAAIHRARAERMREDLVYLESCLQPNN